jgi:hypothetical protein
MTGWLAGWLIGWLAGWLVGWLVAATLYSYLEMKWSCEVLS